MCRYAYFNTNFVYKFAFGIQPSYDMLCFGGQSRTSSLLPQLSSFKEDVEKTGTLERGVSEVYWEEKDREFILSQLSSFGEAFMIPDFEQYEKTVAGTFELFNDSTRLLAEEDDIACFTLGCLIYHQLLYRPDLNVRYEY